MTGDEIRAAVLERMQQQGVTKADLARQLGVSHQAVSGILSGQRGKIPASLERVLSAVGLKLVVVPENTDISHSR